MNTIKIIDTKEFKTCTRYEFLHGESETCYKVSVKNGKLVKSAGLSNLLEFATEGEILDLIRAFWGAPVKDESPCGEDESPCVEDGGVKKITFEEFQELMKAQGVEKEDVTFECPRCKTLQSASDLMHATGKSFDDVGVYLGYSCIGRFDKARGCDWTLGGFFKLHEMEVVFDDGSTRPVFVPKTLKEQNNEDKL